MQSPEVKTSRESRIADEYINFLTFQCIPKAMTLQEISEATQSDSTLNAVIRALQTNNWHIPQDFRVDVSAFQVFKHIRDELSCNDAHYIVLRGSQIVIPKSLQQRTIDIAHEGHQGIVKTKSLMREKVWFPYMDRYIETKIK